MLHAGDSCEDKSVDCTMKDLAKDISTAEHLPGLMTVGQSILSLDSLQSEMFSIILDP